MLWLTLRKLQSRDANDRRSAIEKLAKSKNPNAVAALIDSLDDNETYEHAARALQFQGKAAVDRLLAAVLSDGGKLSSKWMRAAKALSGITDNRIPQALSDFLESSEANAVVQLQAVYALGYWIQPNQSSLDRTRGFIDSSLLHLIFILQSKPDPILRESAALVMFDECFGPQLAKCISEDSNANVRCSAIDSLAMIVQRRFNLEAAHTLLKACNDKDAEVRSRAVQAVATLDAQQIEMVKARGSERRSIPHSATEGPTV